MGGTLPSLVPGVRARLPRAAGCVEPDPPGWAVVVGRTAGGLSDPGRGKMMRRLREVEYVYNDPLPRPLVSQDPKLEFHKPWESPPVNVLAPTSRITDMKPDAFRACVAPPVQDPGSGSDRLAALLERRPGLRRLPARYEQLFAAAFSRRCPPNCTGCAQPCARCVPQRRNVHRNVQTNLLGSASC